MPVAEPITTAAPRGSLVRGHEAATSYAQSLGSEHRKRLAAYFTPPWLVARTLALLEELGADWSTATVVDPAAGGASFVAPVADRVVRALGESGLSATKAIAVATQRVVGIEIEPRLAGIAAEVVDDVLGEHLGQPIDAGRHMVQCGDALDHVPAEPYDIIVANPPYGRISRAQHGDLYRRFAGTASGALNRYAVFVRMALDWLRPGGLAAFVIPTSFLGGPYYAGLRSQIRELAEPLMLGLVERRERVFDEVIQDICALVVRRRPADATAPCRCLRLRSEHDPEDLGAVELPADPVGPWRLPTRMRSLVSGGGVAPRSLADHGVRIAIGSCVPFRSEAALGAVPKRGAVPLLWEYCIRPDGGFDWERGLDTGRKVWVDPEAAGLVPVRGPCVIVQRTSNRKQRQRIKAAVVPAPFVEKYGGFVAENHVIMIFPPLVRSLSLERLRDVLNSAPFNEIFNASAGGFNVPATLLSKMPLPDPDRLRAKLDAGLAIDEAVRWAYGIHEHSRGDEFYAAEEPVRGEPR